MTKTRWLWIHGWGMSPRIWGSLPSSFPDAEHHYADFSGCEQPDDFRETVKRTLAVSSGPWTVVGWSMGALLALETATPEAERLIVFGGTLKFVQRDKRMGTPPRVLEAMRRQLERDPAATLMAFRAAAFRLAVPEPASETDFTLGGLTAGLRYLAEADAREAWTRLRAKTLWLHGTRDEICPVGGAPEGSIHVAGAGHAPFLEQPEFCIREMERLIQR